MAAEAQTPPAQAEREWWLRLVLVLTQPASVFAWVRDDSDEAAGARQEPLTAVVFLSGLGIFFATRTAGTIFDDFEADWLTWFVEVVFAGLLVAAQNFWLVGLAVHLGGRAADSAASYRQARHVVALATVPFALEFVLVWPVRLAMFGSDVFRSGGSDDGAAQVVFRTIDALALAATLVLLVIGARTLNGWRWPRALASLAVTGGLLALVVALFVGVRVGN